MLRFIKFAGSSLVGGTVDMLLVWLLSGYVFNCYWGDVIISPIISFECSVIVGFTFCWYFVWNDGVFGIRMLLVVLIERIFSGNIVIINLISRLLAGLVNYMIADKLIFKKGVL